MLSFVAKIITMNKPLLILFAALTMVMSSCTPKETAVDNSIPIGTEIGNRAPEIEMKGVDGKTIKLSDLRGKLVLIDFWASWCGPCRRENPNVVSAYDKYAGAKFKSAKGFDIFSVSLDKQQDRWEGAIEKDNLKWSSHVSDLKGWQNEAAQLYGVHSIPASFLIDENGVILAKALRGMALHTEIDKHVKKLN